MSFKIKSFNFLDDFFYNLPALFYALFFLLGSAFYLYGHWIFSLFFLVFFFISDNRKKKFFVGLLIFLIGFFYTSFFYSDSKKITSPQEGIGVFKITNVKEGFNFNQKYYIYHGSFKSFVIKNKVYRHLNASIFAKRKHLLNSLYKIEGTLHPNENQNFHFVLKTKKKWEKKGLINHSLISFRSDLKQKFLIFLKKSIKDTH